MTVEEKTYELVFDPFELRWYLNPAGASPKMPYPVRLKLVKSVNRFHSYC